MSDSVIVGHVYNLVGTKLVEPEAEFVELIDILGATQHPHYRFRIWTYDEQGQPVETETIFDLSAKQVERYWTDGKLSLIGDISRLHMDEDGDAARAKQPARLAGPVHHPWQQPVGRDRLRPGLGQAERAGAAHRGALRALRRGGRAARAAHHRRNGRRGSAGRVKTPVIRPGDLLRSLLDSRVAYEVVDCTGAHLIAKNLDGSTRLVDWDRLEEMIQTGRLGHVVAPPK